MAQPLISPLDDGQTRDLRCTRRSDVKKVRPCESPDSHKKRPRTEVRSLDHEIGFISRRP